MKTRNLQNQCNYACMHLYSIDMMARKDQDKHENEEMKEHLMKTTLVMTDIKSELNGTKFERKLIFYCH